ncbi:MULTISPECIES: pyridoxal 5'-phosphate synthase glutaminase subunit PdxT [Pyrobaculum]|uniref:Pyridoxal 5'-phosphate synthase subunit PdxT n=2 Tax=Pyrobaculum arsenaticum TaxID=121277 RepID=PDXT_PYRAR|nr:pyridoxal 5'-phosphate synthase glutaminase subunit PdxT [Pyrobaculum arsenaticum]A4WHH5.1 RecName: Full=Pyridoxal 5'-phosphate synthase subunit PdxT; AltName: Full=Pdx2; AltName: Full=Pyridoxal 5'-phosphate synthase glutaminase subunit [Pyrobaculum arsenaticum DSM 13514]ABP49842.1 pyridoxal phosphate synthase yaaE subunit [Pyrobaculum arsenaticum DSM 13514]NYR15829.1 pyridoxal 5'-phosphate synthase glutaminase subunit PdxT [Pyrobaculum arsenaticum]
MKVGVLALQGDVEEHLEAFRRAAAELNISAEAVRVKRADQLDGLSALAIPGGESTTIGKLAQRLGILDRLRTVVESGVPTLATCAGAVLLAKEVRDSVVGPTGQPLLAVLNAAVVRNAYGRQRDSFEANVDVEGIGTVRAVFIRAPIFAKTWPPARAIAHVDHPRAGRAIVAVRQDHVLATAFHPELTTTAFHKAVLEMAAGRL